jgi:hypothetical protein
MLIFADLEGPLSVEITEYPEPIEGKLFEARINYDSVLGLVSYHRLGFFDSAQEARLAASATIRAERDRREKSNSAAEIRERYVSKTEFRIN